MTPVLPHGQPTELNTRATRTSIMSGQNAATRVHDVIQHAAAINGKTPVVDGLFELFNLGHVIPGVGAGRQAAQRMNQLLDQIDMVATGLTSAGVPNSLWNDPLEQARQGFSPTLLGGEWAQVMANFSPEVLMMLQWAGFVLPPDDGAADHTQVGQLLLDVEEVMMLAEQIELPEVLRQFVSSHLRSLQEGLRVSTVTGMRPLREAIKTVAGDLALRQETINRAVAGLPADAHAICNRVTSSIKKAMELVNQASEPIDVTQKLGIGPGARLSLLSA